MNAVHNVWAQGLLVDLNKLLRRTAGFYWSVEEASHCRIMGGV